MRKSADVGYGRPLRNKLKFAHEFNEAINLKLVTSNPTHIGTLNWRVE